MGFRRLSKEQNQLYELIDNLLWEEWDPIGVNDNPNIRDEYQSYTPQIFSLILKGGTIEDIAQKLLSIETEWIGLDDSDEQILNKNRQIAQKMITTAKQLKLT